MSLLSVCQNVATEVGLYNSPSTVIGNTSNDVVKLLALANRSARDIMKRHEWNKLTIEATINTVASTEGYSLESDYDRIIHNTVWDNTNNRPMIFVNMQEWSFIKNGIVSQAGINKRWVIVGNEILLNPIPSSVDVIKYFYVSNKYVIDSVGTTTYSEFQADTDTVQFSENLLELNMIWRLKKQNGLAAFEEYDSYQRELEMEISRDGGVANISTQPMPLNVINIQDSNFPS